MLFLTYLQNQGVYMKAKFFLPNSLTAINLIISVFAIINILDHPGSIISIVTSAWLVALAAIFDGLDGKVARLTNSQSDFGIEFDSIADFAAFVLTPGIIGYSLMVMSRVDEKLILLSVIVYILGGAVRLARFNVVQGGETEKGLFQGLPTPAGAGNVISMVIFVWYFYGSAMNLDFVSNIMFINLLVTGVLMVSNIKYDNIFSMFKTKNPKFLIMKRFSIQLVIFLVLFVYMVAAGEKGYFFPILIVFYHLKAIFLNLNSFDIKEVE